MLEDWFNTWWITLDSKLFTSKSKGSRAKAKELWDKLNPDKELFDKIMWFTREKMRQDRKLIADGVFVAPWKHAERLIRHRFWEDELLQSEDINQLKEGVQCACGQKAQWGKICWKCYGKTHPDPWKAEREREAKRRNLARSDIDRLKNGGLREILRQTGILVKPES